MRQDTWRSLHQAEILPVAGIGSVFRLSSRWYHGLELMAHRWDPTEASAAARSEPLYALLVCHHSIRNAFSLHLRQLEAFEVTYTNISHAVLLVRGYLYWIIFCIFRFENKVELGLAVTLRTTWSWQNTVSTTAPERAVLSVLSLGVALRTDQSGASEAAETCIFLASIWLAFAGHVVYCFGYDFPGAGDGQRR